MNEVHLTKCVACAEEIKADATLCRFCQTRQDDPSFSHTKEETLGAWYEAAAEKKARQNQPWIVVGSIAGALLVIGGLAYAGLAASRASTATEIESAVAAQVEKLAILNIMGTLDKVHCDPVGLSIAFPETTYKCFASDADGKGMVFKATMDWGTGIYQYGLDRG